MPVDEGKALIESLLEAATAPDKIYRHVWRDNVFLLWDNRCMLHRGQPFDNQKYRRHMIRTTVLAA
ncbi:MAG: TauD/TfdA family dioxygenase [Alphaproteobacteria bacterium]|nr:TauD/TfdA family dioxygenase [Alphaproteobacteria bacterium]